MSLLPLETPRLLLRPYLQGDAAAIAALLDDAEMARHLMVTPYPFVEYDARTLVKASWRRLSMGRGVDLLAVRRDGGDGTLVGSVGIALHDDGARGELGFWIGRPYWGRGYATEAATHALAFAREALGVKRFTATVAEVNAASRAVLARLGFVETGRSEREVPSTGETCPVVLLVLDGAKS